MPSDGEVNEIKSEVLDLRSEFRVLRSEVSSGSVHSGFCNLYVRALDDCEVGVGKSWLELVLRCKVESFSRLGNTIRQSFKVKVLKSVAHDAVVSGRKNRCIVNIWQNSPSNKEVNCRAKGLQDETGQSMCGVENKSSSKHRICSWNCRGFGLMRWMQICPHGGWLIQD